MSLAVFFQNYIIGVLKYPEHKEGQQRSGLCCKTGLKSFHGHFDYCLSQEKLWNLLELWL